LERFLKVLSSLRFGLYHLNGIEPESFQFQFQFWKQKEVTGCQIRGEGWVGYDSNFVCRQKLLGEDGSVASSNNTLPDVGD
jgi:hypothetical protein